MSQSKRALLIAGPTASGKSAVGIKLADRLDGMIINADSMQVYAGLHILTARPDAEEEASAPHRLYGHVAPDQAYSVGQWLDDVAGMLEEAHALGKVPILLGGTGLYFKALTQGLSPIPDIPDALRTYWRAEAERLPPEDLHAALVLRDPISAARLPIADRQRVLRAIEVFEATGRTLTDWQAAPNTPPLLKREDVVAMVLAPERTLLYQRIEQRFDQMVSQGGLDEARAFATLALGTDLPAMKAIGVPPLMAAASGRLSLEEAIVLAKRDTRRFAKRQLTWYRNQLPDWDWATPDNFWQIFADLTKDVRFAP